MKFLLISLYDESCPGLRSVGKTLSDEGHEIHFLHIKCLEAGFVSTSDKNKSHRILSDHPLTPRDVTPLGDIYQKYSPITDKEIELFIKHINDINPGAVGFSVAMDTHRTASMLSTEIKKNNSKIKIIWGGLYSTFFPEKSLNYCDIAATGEGELSILKWAENPNSKEISGLWFKNSTCPSINSNKPVINQKLLFNDNETTLTDDMLSKRMSENKQLIGSNYIFMSDRYCPFNCSFCLSGQLRKISKNNHTKSVQNFIEEISLITNKYTVPEPLLFWDDNFGADESWLDEFCSIYPKEIGIPFKCYIHPLLHNNDSIKLLHKTGAVGISMGLQNGSRRVLKEVYNRYNDVDRIIETAHYIRDAGVKDLQIDYITNCPYEAEDDLKETLETLLRFPKPYLLHMAKLVIYPGSKLAQYKGNKSNLTEKDFDFWNLIFLLTQVDTLSPKEIRTLSKDKHLRREPELLGKIAHSILNSYETINNYREEIKHKDFLLQNSCHKKIVPIIMDKIRYKLERWKNSQ